MSNFGAQYSVSNGNIIQRILLRTNEFMKTIVGDHRLCYGIFTKAEEYYSSVANHNACVVKFRLLYEI